MMTNETLDVSGPLSRMDELIAEAPDGDRRARTLGEFAAATRTLAADPAGGYPPDLIERVAADLTLVTSYDRLRGCLLVLLELAGLFEASEAYRSAGEPLQGVAACLVPALEAIRAGLHPVVARAALLVEEDDGVLVITEPARAEIRRSLGDLTDPDEQAQGVRSLRFLARHMAGRPDAEAAARSLEELLDSA